MTEVLLENSLNISSNLDKLLKKLYEDEINEVNGSADISPYKKLITGVLQRAKEKINFNAFCTVIETPTANGIIPFEAVKYIGKNSADASLSTVRVFTVPVETSFTIDGDISSSAGGVGKVLHVEAGKILVKIISGTFVPTNNLDNTAVYASSKTTLTAIYSANGNYAGFLESYDGPKLTADGEVETDMKEVVSVIEALEILCTTKSIATGFTMETLSDALSVYGYKYKGRIIELITGLLEKLDKARIFKFMRDNAYVRPNIVLTNSYGVNGAMLDIFGDVYTRINQSVGAIKTNANMEGDFVVVASSKIYRALITVTPLSEIEKKVWLPSDIVLVEDSFSTVDYICVSLNNKETSGVVYTPYTVEVQSVIDPLDFKEKIKVFSRSDIKNNPLATKVNDQAKNEMMEVTYIDGYASLNNTF